MGPEVDLLWGAAPQARVCVLPGEDDHVRTQGHESDQGSVTAGLPFLLFT